MYKLVRSYVHANSVFIAVPETFSPRCSFGPSFPPWGQCLASRGMGSCACRDCSRTGPTCRPGGRRAASRSASPSPSGQRSKNEEVTPFLQNKLAYALRGLMLSPPRRVTLTTMRLINCSNVGIQVGQNSSQQTEPRADQLSQV